MERTLAPQATDKRCSPPMGGAVFKLHTKDGRTESVDIADEAQAREWLLKLARREVQLSLTGVTLVSQHGYQVSVVRPVGFDNATTQIEHVLPNGHKGGERVIVFVGDVRLTVMSHADSPAVRIDVARIGMMRYNSAK